MTLQQLEQHALETSSEGVYCTPCKIIAYRRSGPLQIRSNGLLVRLNLEYVLKVSP